MDILRLPVTPPGRPAAAAQKSFDTQAAGERPVAAEPVAPGRRQRRAAEACERVVQGELLQRERVSYQSTRAFLDERTLDHARPLEQAGSVNPQRSRSAIALYANNARPESLADLTQGRSVNFFV